MTWVLAHILLYKEVRAITHELGSLSAASSGSEDYAGERLGRGLSCRVGRQGALKTERGKHPSLYGAVPALSFSPLWYRPSTA